MLNVSKWIKIPLLLDAEEMDSLLGSLSSFHLYQVQKVTPKGEGVLSTTTFLKEYATYVDHLKRGEVPPAEYGPRFSPVLSATEDALCVMEVDEMRQLYKPQLPVVQMQAHAMRYNPEDHSFRSQLFGSDSISWGIQLGYPQVYADPKTHAIFSTRNFPNGLLFREIQKWIRAHTLPTPFLLNGRRENIPIRLGKLCFHWIHVHPQLKKWGLELAGENISY